MIEDRTLILDPTPGRVPHFVLTNAWVENKGTNISLCNLKL